MTLETECILRPNLGTSAEVPDVPSRTSMPLRPLPPPPKKKNRGKGDVTEEETPKTVDKEIRGKKRAFGYRPTFFYSVNLLFSP